MINHEINLREPAVSLTSADRLADGTYTLPDLLTVLGVKDAGKVIRKYPDGSLGSAPLADLIELCGLKAGRYVPDC